MSESSHPTSLSPFSPNYRASGVLLHVTSLTSPYGIGDMGPQARAWVDRLQEAGQTWWQILPLGPTGHGNSPYQPLSSFAGNWLLISPDDLIADGLLRASDVAGHCFSKSTVDYDASISFKCQLLETVWTNFNNVAGHVLLPAFEQFCYEEQHWLDDYALFQALQDLHHGACYLKWPTELVRRDPAALVQAQRDLANQIDQVRLAQFLVFRQANCLKEYAHARGVHLIGDLPFFVSPDSSDVWAHPELFLLDEYLRPRFVAGVPPDYFSVQGQLWGNPVYDWDAIRRTGYRWCIDRVRALLTHVDLIRLDHFRGFAAAWHIAAGASTALSGQWVPGPGSEFFHAVQQDLGGLPFIAEDLGIITPDVGILRDQYHLPGTRVLQFAFDGEPDNPYLPDNYVSNTIVYTGTHDNNTTRGWYDTLSGDQRQNVCQYLQRPHVEGSEVTALLLHLAWSSVAALAVTPLQDLLNLGSDARMNVPGHSEGNWRWRCTTDMLSGPTFQWLRELTTITNRLPVFQSTPESPPNSEVI
ncbi:4-alpha-glucanotransferase [Gimesia algae]|uniref:4-alpha-glucanotransferase n=1 Tax=Gimesia algae TaxID=2527971 RepID=A0A517V707_9PLAN|nr:4-alpha-glucanotransferase [Gimesia algae]QDT88783.1 4-alpha-glucanotransferase [Gimesia algae]